MVGKLLDFCEREVFPHLDEGQRDALRIEIRRRTGDYHRDVIDLLASSSASSVKVNAIAVEARDRLHDHHRTHA